MPDFRPDQFKPETDSLEALIGDKLQLTSSNGIALAIYHSSGLRG